MRAIKQLQTLVSGQGPATPMMVAMHYSLPISCLPTGYHYHDYNAAPKLLAQLNQNKDTKASGGQYLLTSLPSDIHRLARIPIATALRNPSQKGPEYNANGICIEGVVCKRMLHESVVLVFQLAWRIVEFQNNLLSFCQLLKNKRRTHKRIHADRACEHVQ